MLFSGDKLASDPALGRQIWGGDAIVELYNGCHKLLSDVTDDEIRQYHVAAIFVFLDGAEDSGQWFASDAVKEPSPLAVVYHKLMGV